jgi:hypothetical protein
MRIIGSVLFLLLASACESETVCSADGDCPSKNYCYKLPAGDDADEESEGFPYLAEGTCRQDCTSDGDCNGTFRCTEKGLCKDLIVSSRRQWSGYEIPLSVLIEASSQPGNNCGNTTVCLRAAATPAQFDLCWRSANQAAGVAARGLWACFLGNCEGQEFEACTVTECSTELLLCGEA